MPVLGLPGSWDVEVGGDWTYIVDRYGNWYISLSGSISAGAGFPFLGVQYLEGYASNNRWSHRLDEESTLREIIEGLSVTPAGQIGVSAGLEMGKTGSIAWFGLVSSVGGSLSPGWTVHMGKEDVLAWDWVLWTIPGYDSTVKGSPNLHSDDPKHNCGCQ